MNEAELAGLFERTLDDQHLSRGEKKALTQIIEEELPDPQTLSVWRNVAFKVARARLIHPKAIHVLEWFFDVIKMLNPPQQKASVTEAHFSPGPECPGRVTGLFNSAKKKADVCVFTITDDRIAEAILAAHKRGLAIRIITDDEKELDRGSDIRRLRDAGIKIREDHSEHFMHHKFAVFDRSVLVTGSYNWTRSAAVHNQENIVVTDDARLVKAFEETFGELWKKFKP